MQYDFNKDGMSDFMCTNSVQYLIRDDTLYSLVNMRSCDAVTGFKNDRAWAVLVRDELLETLKEKYPELKAGPIVWTSGSLHVYERSFNLIKESL
jgi:thymidylate synthase